MGSSNYLRRLSGVFSIGVVRRLANVWPPFLAAGIGVDFIGEGYCSLKVSMPLRWYNRNYVGTHFGGSLYAMTDPFFMLMFMHNLGKDFIVWDKAAAIEFKKPGKGRVTAEFYLPKELVEEVRAQAKSKGKHVFDLPVEVKNESGETVASVIKTLYVRYKYFKS
jgi:acyl-coenzyme A thioesterase PaaI-like protein